MVCTKSTNGFNIYTSRAGYLLWVGPFVRRQCIQVSIHEVIGRHEVWECSGAIDISKGIDDNPNPEPYK